MGYKEATARTLANLVADELMIVEPDLVVKLAQQGSPNYHLLLVDKKSPHKTQVQVSVSDFFFQKSGPKVRLHLSTDYGTLDEQQVAEILAILRRSKK